MDEGTWWSKVLAAQPESCVMGTGPSAGQVLDLALSPEFASLAANIAQLGVALGTNVRLDAGVAADDRLSRGWHAHGRRFLSPPPYMLEAACPQDAVAFQRAVNVVIQQASVYAPLVLQGISTGATAAASLVVRFVGERPGRLFEILQQLDDACTPNCKQLAPGSSEGGKQRFDELCLLGFIDGTDSLLAISLSVSPLLASLPLQCKWQVACFPTLEQTWRD